MFGPIDNPANEKLQDLNAREWAYLLPLVVLCFWIGLYPKPFFDMLEPATAKLTSTLDSRRPLAYRWDGQSVLQAGPPGPAVDAGAAPAPAHGEAPPVVSAVVPARAGTR
jgi:NADH-quinone oxidoreductase subunit M